MSLKCCLEALSVGDSSVSGDSSVCGDSASPMECSLNGATKQGLGISLEIPKHAYLQILLFKTVHSSIERFSNTWSGGKHVKARVPMSCTLCSSLLTSGILLAMGASWNGALFKDFSTHLVSSSRQGGMCTLTSRPGERPNGMRTKCSVDRKVGRH